MKVKRLGKWGLVIAAIIIIYYLSVYNPFSLNVINIFCLITGVYILTYPGTFSKTNPATFALFENELNQKLKGHENLLSARKEELLADYRGQFIFNTYVIGVPILLTFCLALYAVTISKQMWYEYLMIFCILIFLIFHENNTFKYIPSSRYNRTRLKFFIHELQSNVNSLDRVNKSTMIVNNIEMNHSEIKNDYSQIVYDNRALIIDNTKIQTINQTQTSIDNRVINNDNRVLQNNFITTIETRQNENFKLNMESNFWMFIKLEDDEQDIELKYNKFIDIIHNLNFRFLKSGKRELFRFSDNKIHFIYTSHGKLFAEFTKYLIIEKILDEEIFYTNNRKYLLEIFEVSGGTEFKHFQPSIWNNIDERNIIFYTKFR